MKQAIFLSTTIFLYAGASVGGAEFILDFNTDPTELGVDFLGTSEWRDEGGVNNSGYLSVTDNLNSQIGAIIFPDLEDGQAVTAFSISADLRVGGGTAPPADGFSFNFVRPDDPLLDEDEEALDISVFDGRGNGWAEIPPHPGLYLPEEGSQTGISVLFDTWQNGPASPSGDCDELNEDTGELYDCVGIGVRVDNELVTAKSLPVINGAFDDVESLTTNVDDEFADTGLVPAFFLDDVHDGEGLTWATLEIEYSQSGNLFVAYKGQTIIDQPIDYEPSPGLLVFGGRTGGANAFHHIDNITLRTGSDVGGSLGDFNGNGVLDSGDLDAMSFGDPTFDLDNDGDSDFDDRLVWINDIANTWAGDSDFDGEFGSGDLVVVFRGGKFETGESATWVEGDWNGDGLFGTGDLVFAFEQGGFELGPRPATQIVPEPTLPATFLLILGVFSANVVRRRCDVSK